MDSIEKARLFEDSWKRIDRAIVHGKAFRAEWERVVNPETYTTVIQMNSDWTGGVAKAIAKGVSENSMALELGEFFYQLRAALDAAVYRVAILEGGVDPPASENRVEFPIYDTPKRFKGCAICEGPFPKEMLTWFESIQPYNTAKTAATTHSTLNGPLELLHNCARKDRHRRLHVVAAVPKAMKAGFKVTDGVKITSVHAVEVNFLENESEFLVFGIEGVSKGTYASVKLNTAIEIEVSIDEVPVPDGGNIGTELDRIIEATRFVVARIEEGYNGVGFCM